MLCLLDEQDWVSVGGLLSARGRVFLVEMLQVPSPGGGCWGLPALRAVCVCSVSHLPFVSGGQAFFRLCAKGLRVFLEEKGQLPGHLGPTCDPLSCRPRCAFDSGSQGWRDRVQDAAGKPRGDSGH